ncbi:MAG: site-2 protease family protein [Phycisphaeraceae bacterium]|nr:site-2 protease family protein [Phycisphaeraceae bacterium]
MAEKNNTPMRGAWRIATAAGIGIYVHWTFLLLPALVAGQALLASNLDGAARVNMAVFNVSLVLAVFVCVVLHELGHALMARRFGVRTKDIVLLPIGGVARLERIPRNPVQELLIALAGPAVNVVIAAALGAGLLAAGAVRGDALSLVRFEGGLGFVPTLAAINIVLVVFNMIPAFPMDGGRVLRALLAMTMPHDRATHIAARVGQFAALGFVILAVVTKNPFLLLIAAMVFFGAGAEATHAQTLGRLAGRIARDAMMTEFAVVRGDAPLGHAAELLLSGSHRDFPIVGPDGAYAGMLSRESILAAIAELGPDAPAAMAANHRAPTFDETQPAAEVFERMQAAGAAAAAVLRDGRTIGVVTIENLADLLDISAAMSAARAQQSAPASAVHTPGRVRP